MNPWIDMLRDITRIATGGAPNQPDPKDKRFSDPVWQSNGFYKSLLEAYLLWQRNLNTMLESANLPKQEHERARLAISLLADAAAPTNTLLGNPAALQRAFETGGTSALDGVRHMFEDVVQRAACRPRWTSESSRLARTWLFHRVPSCSKMTCWS